MNKEKVWCASFDIGKKNFAFYIEEFDRGALLACDNVDKANRYNPNGTATDIFDEVLRKVCNNGKRVLFVNSDLTNKCEKGSYLDPETFHNMTDLLDKYAEYWDKCLAFVIEKQMSFGKTHNTMALKLGQHCYSYFCFRYSRFKEIIEFPAYYKTQILGAHKIEKKTKKGNVSYKAMDKPTRKKWSVQKATEILNERQDTETISSLTNARKRDDLADCLTQLQAWKYLVFVDKSI